MWVSTTRPTPACAACSPASSAVRWPRTPLRSGRGSVASTIRRSAPRGEVDQLPRRAASRRRRRAARRRSTGVTADRVRVDEVGHQREREAQRADLDHGVGGVLLEVEGLLDQLLVAPRADDLAERLARPGRRDQPRPRRARRCPASGGTGTGCCRGA